MALDRQIKFVIFDFISICAHIRLANFFNISHVFACQNKINFLYQIFYVAFFLKKLILSLKNLLVLISKLISILF